MMTAPRWADTTHDLHAASSVEELWGVLLSWHGIRSSTQWEEAYVLFRRFHAEEPAGAVITVALLCTDHRWRRASHHLIARIVASGLLAAADELQLAEWFTAPTLGVGLEVAENASLDEIADLSAGLVMVPVGDPGVTVVERSIWPPLRRWAAARLVAQDPKCWRSLLDAASALPARDGAALAAGVMDATTHLPSAERAEAVDAGLASGSGVVRLAALPALAAIEGTGYALARVATDPSAKVRAWTPTVQATPDTEPATAPGATVDRRDTQKPGQASLF
jgi:hypothetical protein